MIDHVEVEKIKGKYKTGMIIKLKVMLDPLPVEPGTIGKVKFVDDEGQIFMDWNNGRTLPLVPDLDEFTILE